MVKIDQVTNIIANAVRHLIDNDFGLPIHVFSTSSNGSIFLCRYEKSPAHTGLEIEVLYENFRDDVFLIPINFMFIGASGKTARMVIERVGDDGPLQYLS